MKANIDMMTQQYPNFDEENISCEQYIVSLQYVSLLRLHVNLYEEAPILQSLFLHSTMLLRNSSAESGICGFRTSQ